MTEVKVKRGNDFVGRLGRWFRGIDPPSEERMTDGGGPPSRVESNGAGRVDPGPKGDWEHQPPTDKQRNYITVLGGDQSSVRTRRAAADLIDGLVERQRRSPLNPYRLEERGKRLGAEAGDDWKSAHYSLLAGLRLDLQQWINSTLDSLRAKLSDSTGPRVSTQTYGPDDFVRDAKLQLERLRVWRQHGNLGTPPPKALDDVSPIGRPPSFIDKSPVKDAESQPQRSAPVGDQHTTSLSLLNTMAALVVVEALANIVLLMRALPGGALAAFVLALLVSVINVGGIGISIGLLLSWLGRKGMRGMQRLGLVAWPLVALVFNLVAGRHREAYARVVAAIQQDPAVAASPPLPASFLPEISYNPLTWEFEALLFALLGTFLCGWGFAKGFGFRDGSWMDNPGKLSNGERNPVLPSSEPGRRTALSAYQSVLQRYRERITALRDAVASWYRTLDQDRRDVSDTVSMLEEKQNRQACIDCIEHAFITAYNNSHAEKISLQTVEAHRHGRYPEPLLVGPSDRGILEEATALISEWHESGRSRLEEHITQTQEQLTALWAKYEPLVLAAGNDAKSPKHSRSGP